MLFIRSPSFVGCGRSSLASAVSGVHPLMERREARFSYKASDLLKLRQKPCVGLPRRLRRFLLILGIMRHCSLPHVTASYPIPVRITLRKPPRMKEVTLPEVPKPLCSTEFPELANPSLRDTRIRVDRPRQMVRRRRGNKKQCLPSILLSNLRSIGNKFDEVSLKISSLCPDIAVFTESWLEPDIPDSSLAIQNYSVCRKDRNRHGGGIVAYISDRHNHRTLCASDIPLLNQCSSEFLAIVFTDSPVLLICVYHPFWNNVMRDNQCLDVITSIIDYTLISSVFDSDLFRIIVCGDFNGFHSHYDEISRTTRLKSVVSSPTRGPNILDQVFVNFSCESKAIVSPPLGSSDHSLVFWNPSSHYRCQTKKISVRKFSVSKKSQFIETVNNTDWLAIVKSYDDLDSCSSFFSKSLYSLFNHFFPLRVVRLRSTDPPWMKPSLKMLIDDRDRAFSKKQSSKYLRLRKEVNRHTRELKKLFLTSAISSKNSKSVWRSLRIVGRGIKPFTTAGSVDELNNYFGSTFQSCSRMQFPVLPDDLPSVPLSLSCSDVTMSLRKLRNKSPGVDGLPSWVLRDLAEILSPAITFIFNWSLKDCRVPSSFKFANVTPVPKCPRPSDVTHFRPISLLPILSKVLERTVARKWILPYLSSSANRSQFAYLPGSGGGTTTALTLMEHEILKFLDSSSGAVRILSVDFAKAFDKIPHSGIVSACINFRLPKDVILWIMSFLCDRFQRVKCNGQLSSWKFASSGVPQGSVIGPLLFCMFVDDIKALCKNSSTFKYADDVTILHFIRKASDDKLQLEFNKVISWSECRGLPINFTKCKVLDIVTKKTLNLSSIVTSDSTVVPVVASITLLGVTISNDLRWNLHVDSIIKKASRRIFLIRNLRKAGCPYSTMFLAYTSLIRSVLVYAYPSFCNFPLYLQAKLLRLERRVFRIIKGGEDNDLPTVIDTGELLCQRLFNKVVADDNHPLRSCFTLRTSRTRTNKVLQPLKAITSRFSSSFMRFGR